MTGDLTHRLGEHEYKTEAHDYFLNRLSRKGAFFNLERYLRMVCSDCGDVRRVYDGVVADRIRERNARELLEPLGVIPAYLDDFIRATIIKPAFETPQAGSSSAESHDK